MLRHFGHSCFASSKMTVVITPASVGCGLGFVASSFEDIVKASAAAVKGGDFEGTLTDKCAVSASCPSFATITNIEVTECHFQGLFECHHRLGPTRSIFAKTFKVLLSTMVAREFFLPTRAATPSSTMSLSRFTIRFTPFHSFLHTPRKTLWYWVG